MKQGRLDDALRYLKRAIAIKDSLGYENELPHTYNSLAELFLELHQPDSALAKVQQARMLSLKYNTRDQLSESYRITANIHAAKKDYNLAYEDILRYKQLSDSLFTEESDRAISALKIGHETTLKENKITQLTAENHRTTAAKFIFLGIGILVLITGASLVYALYIRRSRDQLLLKHERELHEMQNRFFANISHEFRTPLTLILGPLHQLREKLSGTKDELHLKVIQKNAERLLQLINQILDLVRFDKHVLELKKENFNMTQMINGIASSFDSLAESRHIDFKYETEDHIFLSADRKRLEILLVNLVSNAFKFTPDHGSILIQAGIHPDQKQFWLEVQDSGAGISEENLPKIFDRYFHDDRQSHSDFEGAGIGLALSKHIVEMHGGTISVTSHLHEGTTFKVTLPWQEISAGEKGRLRDAPIVEYENEFTAHPDHASAVNQIYHGSKPILLVVEDRQDMRQYVVSLLQRQYHVLEAADAFAGFELAIEHVPDIIISDVMMPGKNGLELCRELKTDVRTSHIPVILLTAKSARKIGYQAWKQKRIFISPSHLSRKNSNYTYEISLLPAKKSKTIFNNIEKLNHRKWLSIRWMKYSWKIYFYNWSPTMQMNNSR
jgi:signal transduction histidine kinase/CheY-like chemotaxis protein